MDVDSDKPLSEISDGVDNIFISGRIKRVRPNIVPVTDVREDYKRRTLPPLLPSEPPNTTNNIPLPSSIPPIDPSSRVSNSILRHQTPFNVSSSINRNPSACGSSGSGNSGGGGGSNINSNTTSPPQLPLSPNILFYPPPSLDLNQINNNNSNNVGGCDRKIYESPYNSCLPSLEPLDNIKKDKYVGPTDESNWLIPNHLMIGAFPGDISNHITYHNLGNIMRLGIGTFVCLQEEYDPDPNISVNDWKSGKKLRPYFRDVKRIYKDGSLWSLPTHIKPKSIDFIHFPIVDLTTSSNDSELFYLCKEIINRLENGEKLYIHCWGGHGRAGMVGSIIIGLCYNLKPAEAMERVQKCHDMRKCNLNVSSPQTTEQRLQVARILLSPISRQYIFDRFNPQPPPSNNNNNNSDINNSNNRRNHELPSNCSSPRSTYSCLSARFSNGNNNSNSLLYTPVPPPPPPYCNNNNSNNNGLIMNNYRRIGVRYSSSSNNNNNNNIVQSQPIPPPPPPVNKRPQNINYNFRQNQYTTANSSSNNNINNNNRINRDYSYEVS